MAIAAGQCIATAESKTSEHGWDLLIQEIYNEKLSHDPRFSYVKSYPWDKIFGSGSIAKRTDGSSSEFEPDPCIVLLDNKPWLFFENKHQKSRQNAVQRWLVYLAIAQLIEIPYDRIFVNFEGSGFEYDGEKDGIKTMSGTTGVNVQIAKSLKTNWFVNESREVIKTSIVNKIDELLATI